ncbi:MAG: ATP-dependent DNA helicase [Natronomonas sp.]
MDLSRLFEEFPAPSYRGTQEQALESIKSAFADGNRVVLVRAPTGSGKSLLARAVAGCARRSGVAPAKPDGAYYTTPQVSQLDDVAGDPLLSDLSVIRGKHNYNCILSGETTTPVTQAPCARERSFDCPQKHRCPYFADRGTAAEAPIAAMTLAYFMHTADTDAFGQRDIVVVDEAHGLAEWAETYATVELSPTTVPVWDAVETPNVEELSDAVEFAETILTVAERRREELQGRVELTRSEVTERDQIDDLRRDAGWFLDDAKDAGSPTTWVADQADDGSVTVKPMRPARYLDHTVWNRGRHFLLLSATILDKTAFCRSVGLDPASVALVDVPHTFPVENRPLYDVTCGKMTYDRREETLPELARTAVRLMQRHDEKGLIHAHSYDIASRLTDRLADFGVGERIRSHGRENRDAALSDWKRSDGSDVFVSVKMEEALDLDGDLCRWQLLCKAPYPNTRDSRVARRLEEGQWNWYYRNTLQTVIQACGRIVRSPDDHGATYLADSSLLDLFERARGDLPSWFADSVDRMTSPELPAFDPAAAVDGSSTRRRSHSKGSSSDIDDHPLSDVWGE